MKKWIPVLYLLTGLFCGWLIFGGEKTDNASLPAESPTQVWTCSMHPQIRLHEAVPCPLCGMALTPIGETETSDSLTLVLSETAARLAMIQTASVTRGKAEKKLLLQGKLVPDERFVSQITAPYPGRIERLRINTAGMEVEKNAIVADLYSPELISAQTEFFDATSLRMMAPEVYLMARNRLRRWNIPEDIIEGIEYGKPLLKDFPIYAPVSGTVIRRSVTEGQYVEEGTELFEIANLGRIWAVFDVYEPDLPWIKKGNSVSFTTPSAPGKTFSGKIAFIDPLVDSETRTVTIRVEVPNPDRLLKPEMYIYGSVSVSETAQQPPIVVSKTAVLWTGSHSLVYIHIPETKPPVFQLREVVLGPDLGSEYVILEGLAEGEEIVVNGVFKIDAAAQLAGKYSMMNPPHPLRQKLPGKY
ncbi:MAG: efflux RND transporter periplasmic adaptor subunit [Bacteroidia bacterium]|nr:efflux RND transporter periplasmic adaptor subunit [Bacteroidia bacterium]